MAVMLVDTDVLIWNLRGHEGASDYLDWRGPFSVSAVTWMALVQGARDKSELRGLRQALRFWSATIVHVSEALSARASFCDRGIQLR